MAKTNDVIENPVTGEKITFLITSEDSNGDLLKMHVWNKVGAQGPPEHFHVGQTESFEVISGTAGFKCDGKEYILTAGQSIVAPEKVPHTFWNAGDTPLELIVECQPALRLEFMLETIYSLSKKGKLNRNGSPKNFLQLATILDEYYGEQFRAGIPITIQNIVAKTFGKIGRVAGYKGFVPYDGNSERFVENGEHRSNHRQQNNTGRIS